MTTTNVKIDPKTIGPKNIANLLVRALNRAEADRNYKNFWDEKRKEYIALYDPTVAYASLTASVRTIIKILKGAK